MRINVYAEELPSHPKDVEFVYKNVDGRRFYGVRVYLKSTMELHHTDADDDRSAITFWVPWRKGANHHRELIQVLDDMVKVAHDARRHDESHLNEKPIAHSD